jgi:hypothetical protein
MPTGENRVVLQFTSEKLMENRFSEAKSELISDFVSW